MRSKQVKCKTMMALLASAMALMPLTVVAQTPSNDIAANPSSSNSDESKQASTMLFVSGPNMGFVGFDHADSLSGSKVTATTDLTLSSKTVLQPRDAVLDGRGALYLLSNANGGSIAIYDNPRTASGSRPPDRIVSGEATRISKSATGIAIDRASGKLFVSNANTDTLVFDISAPESFNGNIAPVTTFDVDVAQFRPEQLRFANGSLYMVDARGGTSDILAFDNPGSLRGKVKPDRVITYADFDNKIGVDIDAKDRLLVGVRKLGQLLIFNDASKLDGVATPDVSLLIAGAKVAPKPSFASTDSADRLYIADASGNVTFSFDHASEIASGEHYPDRTIAGSDLIAPNRLVVVEQTAP